MSRVEAIEDAPERASAAVSLLRASAAHGKSAESPAGKLGEAAVAVWSPVGSPGKSSIALALAACLAASSRSVALVDADTHAPALDIMLGLQQRTAGLLAVARLARQDRYSDDEHERLVTAVGPGKSKVQFVAGLASLPRWSELEPIGLKAAFEQLSSRSEIQIFDLASPLDSALIEPEFATQRNTTTRYLLSQCATTLVVTSPEPVSIARLIADFGEVRHQAPGRILIVVNRFRTSTLGTNAKRQITDVLRQQLGEFEIFFVPDEPALFDAAIAKATSVAWLRPRSSATRAVRNIADAIAHTSHI